MRHETYRDSGGTGTATSPSRKPVGIGQGTDRGREDRWGNASDGAALGEAGRKPGQERAQGQTPSRKALSHNAKAEGAPLPDASEGTQGPRLFDGPLDPQACGPGDPQALG